MKCSTCEKQTKLIWYHSDSHICIDCALKKHEEYNIQFKKDWQRERGYIEK